MTEFQNKKFNVYPGKDGGKTYRDNWDAIFGDKDKARKEAEAAEAKVVEAINKMFETKKPEPTREPEPCSICGGTDNPALWGHKNECPFWDAVRPISDP